MIYLNYEIGDKYVSDLSYCFIYFNFSIIFNMVYIVYKYVVHLISREVVT